MSRTYNVCIHPKSSVKTRYFLPARKGCVSQWKRTSCVLRVADISGRHQVGAGAGVILFSLTFVNTTTADNANANNNNKTNTILTHRCTIYTPHTDRWRDDTDLRENVVRKNKTLERSHLPECIDTRYIPRYIFGR